VDAHVHRGPEGDDPGRVSCGVPKADLNSGKDASLLFRCLAESAYRGHPRRLEAILFDHPIAAAIGARRMTWIESVTAGT